MRNSLYVIPYDTGSKKLWSGELCQPDCYHNAKLGFVDGSLSQSQAIDIFMNMCDDLERQQTAGVGG